MELHAYITVKTIPEAKLHRGSFSKLPLGYAHSVRTTSPVSATCAYPLVRPCCR